MAPTRHIPVSPFYVHNRRFASTTGAIYILRAERVHPLNVPFTHAVKTVTRWGSGSKELVKAMQGHR
jgi:hypothetical protein